MCHISRTLIKVTFVTNEGIHPCTYVTEDENVCILDEGDEPSDNNCWNQQNCKNRGRLALFNESSEDAVVTVGPVSAGLVSAGFAVNSALAVVLSIACLIY